MIDTVLQGWNIYRVNDLADIVMGQSPDSDTYNSDKVGLPFIQGKADFGRKNPVIRKYTTDPKKVSEQGDILFTVRAPVGALNMNVERISIGRGVAALREHDKSMFLYYYLMSCERYFRALEQGTTFTEINQRELKRLKVLAPKSNKERGKIAETLSAVDEAIDKARETIAKAERVKKALMQNLLTGKLKPDGTWRKESEFQRHEKLGLIPKEWEPKRIRDVITDCQYGLSKSMSDQGKYPIFRMNNIVNGRMVNSPMAYINLDDEEFQKYKVAKHDILINRTNSPDLVGKVGIFDLEGDYVFASYLIRIQIDENNDPEYINYYLNSYAGQTRLKSKATPSGHQNPGYG